MDYDERREEIDMWEYVKRREAEEEEEEEEKGIKDDEIRGLMMYW
jgi:hypothetical protein